MRIRRGENPVTHVVRVILEEGTALLQSSTNRVELRIKAGTQAVHRSYNRKRDACCDQTIFNRGCPRLVRQEPKKATPQARLLFILNHTDAIRRCMSISCVLRLCKLSLCNFSHGLGRIGRASMASRGIFERAPPAQMKTPPEKIRRGLMPGVAQVREGGRISLQCSADLVEISVECCTHTVHCSDDRNRDTGRDQTIFNRGCPRLIRQELRD
jgi:hypothetical protein